MIRAFLLDPELTVFLTSLVSDPTINLVFYLYFKDGYVLIFELKQSCQNIKQNLKFIVDFRCSILISSHLAESGLCLERQTKTLSKMDRIRKTAAWAEVKENVNTEREKKDS